MLNINRGNETSPCTDKYIPRGLRISVSPPRQTTAGTHARGHEKACARARSPPPPLLQQLWGVSKPGRERTSGEPQAVLNPKVQSGRAPDSSQACSYATAAACLSLETTLNTFSEHLRRRRAISWNAGCAGGHAARGRVGDDLRDESCMERTMRRLSMAGSRDVSRVRCGGG